MLVKYFKWSYIALASNACWSSVLNVHFQFSLNFLSHPELSFARQNNLVINNKLCRHFSWLYFLVDRRLCIRRMGTYFSVQQSKRQWHLNKVITSFTIATCSSFFLCLTALITHGSSFRMLCRTTWFVKSYARKAELSLIWPGQLQYQMHIF